MSDDLPGVGDIPEPIEPTDSEPVSRDPEVVQSERLAKQLGVNLRRVKSEDIKDELSSEHARQVFQDDLERLYQGDLNTNNPPDSIKAFENRVTLRNLASLATRFGAPNNVLFEPRNIVIEVSDADSAKFEPESFESFLEAQTTPAEPTRAKKAIDRMAAYGQPAEQFLAIVADDEEVHPEIAEYALDALAELQEREEERDGLIDTLRSWWSGGSP